MRQALAPVLCDDHDRAAAETQRRAPVAKARVSPAARRKASTRFGKELCATVLATPTPFQQHVFQLLGVTPGADP